MQLLDHDMRTELHDADSVGSRWDSQRFSRCKSPAVVVLLVIGLIGCPRDTPSLSRCYPQQPTIMVESSTRLGKGDDALAVLPHADQPVCHAFRHC